MSKFSQTTCHKKLTKKNIEVFSTQNQLYHIEEYKNCIGIAYAITKENIQIFFSWGSSGLFYFEEKKNHALSPQNIKI